MGWLPGWNKRIKLVIDQTNVDTSAQTNFPVLVYLSAASGIGDVDVSCVFDELTADGNRKKIAITTDDGTTECYVEIERWDDANEKAWLWVKVPSVAHDADTDIYLYYDSGHADNDTYVGDTTDAVTHNVWDSDFVGVWHMAQDPNGDAADAIKDSTSCAHEGTPSGTMVTADLVDGQIGKAINFDAIDDHINVGDVTEIGAQSAVTWEATVKNAADVADHGIIGKWDTDHQFFFWMDEGNDKWQAIVGDDEVVQESLMVQPGLVAPNGSWQYVVGVLDGTDLNLYVDLADGGSDTNVAFAGGLHDIVGDVYIGADNDNDHHFGNDIDEVRISKIARSQPWLKATYYSNTDAIITFGSEETVVANLLDGKIIIKGIATNLLDGKLSISPQINLLDGKVQIKDTTTNLLDGKVQIKETTTNLLDGKVQVKDSAINLLDGRALVTYTGQIDDYCPTPTCDMSAVFRYARIEASPPVPTASFRIGKILEGDCPVPDFTCIAYSGRTPALIASAPCPTCSMRIGIALTDDIAVPCCTIVADTHHLTTIYGRVPVPLITCLGDTGNITVISATVSTPTGLFETTIGNVCSILGRSPCPYCTMVALTGQVVALSGRVPVPGSLVRFIASLENVTITLEGTVPTPTMTSSVGCFTSSILRHVRGRIR